MSAEVQPLLGHPDSSLPLDRVEPGDRLDALLSNRRAFGLEDVDESAGRLRLSAGARCLSGHPTPTMVLEYFR